MQIICMDKNKADKQKKSRFRLFPNLVSFPIPNLDQH